MDDLSEGLQGKLRQRVNDLKYRTELKPVRTAYPPGIRLNWARPLVGYTPLHPGLYKALLSATSALFCTRSNTAFHSTILVIDSVHRQSFLI